MYIIDKCARGWKPLPYTISQNNLDHKLADKWRRTSIIHMKTDAIMRVCFIKILDSYANTS